MFKVKQYRNKKILNAARGENCLIQSPYCTNDSETVVACHSNDYDDGKGRGQKAHDCFVAFGCAACHNWVDGRLVGAKESKEERQYYHDRGIKRTILRLLEMEVLK